MTKLSRRRAVRQARQGRLVWTRADVERAYERAARFDPFFRAKVWLDDERPAPEGWVAARWPEDVISMLEKNHVTHISLDHDLGDEARDGYRVLTWIEEAVATSGFMPPHIAIHSANAAARVRMQMAIESIGRLMATKQRGYAVR